MQRHDGAIPNQPLVTSSQHQPATAEPLRQQGSRAGDTLALSLLSQAKSVDPPPTQPSKR